MLESTRGLDLFYNMWKMEKIRVVLQLLLVLLSIVLLVVGICQGRIDFLLLAIAGLILSRSLSIDNIKH